MVKQARTYILHQGFIRLRKQEFKSSDKSNNSSSWYAFILLKRQILDAAILDTAIYSVTNKPNSQLPPSGNRNDFYSLARFYWPSQNGTINGLVSYERREGETNPEIYDLPDSTWIQVMIDDVFHCSMAYFFTGNEVYAEKAVQRIRDWFLNEETAMRPNLNFANWVKGTSLNEINGNIPISRSSGILGTIHHFP
jgi:hypothetical protein